MRMVIFFPKQILIGTKLTLKEGIRNRWKKQQIDKYLLCARDCFQDLLILGFKTIYVTVSVRMTKTSLLMPDLHHQVQQSDGTKAPPESGTLMMHLEVGHWGLQACHPDSLPSTLDTGDSGSGRQRRKIRHSVDSGCYLILIENEYLPSDRGGHSPFSVTDLQLTS